MHLLKAALDTLANLPLFRRAVVALKHEPSNLSSSATVATIQSAIRAAEGGDTQQLFSLYRDLLVSGSHALSEYNKRILAVLAQPLVLLPADKTKPEDVAAAAVCTAAIAQCENWMDGEAHLLSSCLWPVSVCEKIYRPVQPGEPLAALGLRYALRRLDYVNPTLLCFRQPYPTNVTPVNPVNPVTEIFEPDLRFYSTDTDGRIIRTLDSAYPAERERHVIHRGHLLIGVPDSWGGPMRAILFWDYLSKVGRDLFARGMDRFGMPFPVGHTDAKNPDAIALLETAFAQSTKIGGLVVDHETVIELKEIAVSGMADAHEKFITVCHREISKVIVGQTMSAEAQSTGLGSSVGKVQSGVREDIRMFDQVRLGETLRTQVFAPFLRINGIPGDAPRPSWGGLSEEDAKSFADTLEAISRAGFEPTDEAIPTLSDRLGIPIQRKAPPMPAILPGTLPGPLSDPSDPSDEPAPSNEPLSAASRGRLITLSPVNPVNPVNPVDPVDAVAARRAKALADAYRGSMAPFRQAILASSSREECLKKLSAAYADWPPDRLAAELETALQLCAASD